MSAAPPPASQPASPYGGPPAPRRWWDRLDEWGFTRRVRRRLALLLLVIVVAMAGMAVHPAYVIFRPGPVYDTLGDFDGKPVIEVKGAETYETTGDLSFTTVAVYGGPEREITLWDYLWARVQPGSDVRPTEEVYPSGVTRQQIQEQNTIQMSDAQDGAKAVAMRAAGRTVPETITIAGVAAGGPADGVLRKGDQVVSVGGAPVSTVTQLRQAIQSGSDGATLPMVVKRDGSELGVKVATTVSDGRRVIGVGLRIDFHYPVDVVIHAGSIGGPSAGLMFSLGLYDKLTPGPLTGGARIAGTGTIADDGAVGPIGGIAHKMAGARGQRADWFLAPADNCSDVAGHVPDGLSVVKVGSFEQARRAVEEIAAGRGKDLPRC